MALQVLSLTTDELLVMLSTSKTSGPQNPPLAANEEKMAAECLLLKLPALPTVSTRLLGIMGRPDVNFREVSNLILSDAALSLEILRMSNSALFGARTEVRTILQALGVLGSERVKGLACTVALRSYLGNALQIPALKRCWRHNLTTAVVASEIANWVREDSAEAYTAGILHDVGRLALIALDPAKYLRVLDSAAVQGGNICQSERAAYGLDHTSAGEWLATCWGLPPYIRTAIRDHHDIPQAPYDEISSLIYYSCQIADGIGFPVLKAQEPTDAPVQEFLAHLTVAQRDRLNIDVGEFQILIASRVNALEA
jgi:putative nucleotidyltransferase with HDIG domain